RLVAQAAAPILDHRLVERHQDAQVLERHLRRSQAVDQLQKRLPQPDGVALERYRGHALYECLAEALQATRPKGAAHQGHRSVATSAACGSEKSPCPPRYAWAAAPRSWALSALVRRRSSPSTAGITPSASFAAVTALSTSTHGSSGRTTARAPAPTTPLRNSS